MQHYAEGRDASVLLQLIAPRSFLLLWLLLGMLVSSMCMVWLTPVPIYASGVAMVVDWRHMHQSLDDDTAVLVFLSPEYLSRLHRGQPLLLATPSGPLRREVIAVEPEIISPAAIRSRFGIHEDLARIVNQPAAVVLTRLEPLASNRAAASYVGSVFRADIEIGKRRVGSLLPLPGPFMGGR
jgi:hypothetical protein